MRPNSSKRGARALNWSKAILRAQSRFSAPMGPEWRREVDASLRFARLPHHGQPKQAQGQKGQSRQASGEFKSSQSAESGREEERLSRGAALRPAGVPPLLRSVSPRRLPPFHLGTIAESNATLECGRFVSGQFEWPSSRLSRNLR